MGLDFPRTHRYEGRRQTDKRHQQIVPMYKFFSANVRKHRGKSAPTEILGDNRKPTRSLLLLKAMAVKGRKTSTHLKRGQEIQMALT